MELWKKSQNRQKIQEMSNFEMVKIQKVYQRVLKKCWQTFSAKT